MSLTYDSTIICSLIIFSFMGYLFCYFIQYIFTGNIFFSVNVYQLLNRPFVRGYLVFYYVFFPNNSQ